MTKWLTIAGTSKPNFVPMESTSNPVIVEQTFNRPVPDVWKAITEVDQMTQWFFENIPAFQPEVGFTTQFNVESGGRNFLHLWRVTEVIHLQKITYSWKYEGYPGDSFVTFELSDEGDKTQLRLTHQVTESFPLDIPEFTRESCLGGWNFFIGKSLKEYLEGKIV